MNQIRTFAALSVSVLSAAAFLTIPTNAAPAQGQRTFASPREAAQALASAAESHDKTALHEILGKGCDQFLPKDQSRAEADLKKFATAARQNYACNAENKKQVVLEVGADHWPFPIPLACENNRWFFDTAAGEQEILNRYIGSDELHAIGVCRAYAQPGGNPSENAQLATLLARARSYDYANKNPDARTCHGYVFKAISAPKNQGAALLAYPAEYGRTGVMTFMAGPDGKLYERDLGEKTGETAPRLVEYHPTWRWKLVRDQGVQDWNIAQR